MPIPKLEDGPPTLVRLLPPEPAPGLSECQLGHRVELAKTL